MSRAASISAIEIAQLLKSIGEKHGIQTLEVNGGKAMPLVVSLVIAEFSQSLVKLIERPSDDRLWDQTLRDRDQYHEWADKLATAIGKYLEVDIGEHSNANLPWAVALEALEDEIAEQEQAWPDNQ